MRADRAKRIAASFSQAGPLKVCESGDGLLVSFYGKRRYFVREAAFWPFIYRLAGIARGKQGGDAIYRA